MFKYPLLKRQQFTLSNLIRHILTAWLIAVNIEYLFIPSEHRHLNDMNGLMHMSLGHIIINTVILTLVLFVISSQIKYASIQRLFLYFAFTALTLTVVTHSFTWPFFVACLLILLIIFSYCFFGWDNSPEIILPPMKDSKIWPLISGLIAIFFFLFLCRWGISRIEAFATPTYDFGIFAQMFYHMKESGLPLTTLERDQLLNHFAVHVSPVYYLLLPFYLVFPEPVALPIFQAAILALAVIPVYKLSKLHGFSGCAATLMVIILFLFPAYAGGISYDIHENCFLTPLILWLFYAIDKKKPVITLIFTFLVLSVKEDAAVYVAVIGLWLLIKSLLKKNDTDYKNIITGIELLIISILYFIIATYFLAKHGDGVMTYRYNNFMFDNSGSLTTVIKSVIMNPLKAIFECVDFNKLKFIGLTLFSLTAIPLFTRRFERYILLIPYILLNLMSDYQYQHDIFFQYTFGSTAFLIYLVIINIADIKTINVKYALQVGIIAFCAFGFWVKIIPAADAYAKKAEKYDEYYQNVIGALDTVPEDIPVSATSFYTTYLSQRPVIYDISNCSVENLLSTDYIIFDSTTRNEFKKYADENVDNGYENFIRILTENGYYCFSDYPRTITIYKK